MVIIETTPGASGRFPQLTAFAPPQGFNGDDKGYVEWLRTLWKQGALYQEMAMVAGWICAPRLSTPMFSIHGPYAQAFRTFAKVLHEHINK